MGARGRLKKPAYLKKLEGNPGRRPFAEDPPQPEKAPAVVCPSYFDEERRELWGRLCEELWKVQCLARIDAFPLERYVDALVQWRRARTALQTSPQTFEVYETKIVERAELLAGEVVRQQEAVRSIKQIKTHPQVAIYLSLSNGLLRIEKEFGMTAAARMRITAEASTGGFGGDDGDDDDELGLDD